MRILIVLTSHGEIALSGEKNGFWLEALAAPYYVFNDFGAEITLASPLGGKPPMDPKSAEKEFITASTDRFLHDITAQVALTNTLKLAEVSPDNFDALFYPGGQGLLWDLAENKDSIAMIEKMYAQGKPVAAVCHAPGVFRHARLADGSPLVQGKSVTGASNAHETLVGLADAVPFLVEDELKKCGGNYTKVADWQSYSVQDGNLITGQNPASAEVVAKRVLALLGKT